MLDSLLGVDESLLGSVLETVIGLKESPLLGAKLGGCDPDIEGDVDSLLLGSKLGVCDPIVEGTIEGSIDLM